MIKRFVLCGVLGSLFVVGCGDTGGGGTGGTGGTINCPTGEIACDGVCITEFSNPPTLAELQTGVFNGSCALSAACHSGPNPAEMLDLSDTQTSEDNLVDIPSVQSATLDRVLSGDSTMSYLMNKLDGVGLERTSGDQPSAQMPLGSVLCEAKTEAVRAWINSL